MNLGRVESSNLWKPPLLPFKASLYHTEALNYPNESKGLNVGAVDCATSLSGSFFSVLAISLRTCGLCRRRYGDANIMNLHGFLEGGSPYLFLWYKGLEIRECELYH